MDQITYTEDDLKAKKYGELLKITKSLGLRCTADKGGRLKTSKLIENILESQEAPDLAEEASAVVSALDESLKSITDEENGNLTLEAKPKESNEPSKEVQPEESETPDSEELLSDIQFPGDLDDEAGEKIEESEAPTQAENSVSVIQLPGDLDNKENPATESDPIVKTSVEASDSKPKGKRSRRSTFDVSQDAGDGEEGARKSKHRHTGTYEVSEDGKAEVAEISQDSKAEVAPRATKRRRTSTFDVEDAAVESAPSTKKVEENSDQLQALVKRISSTKRKSTGVGSPSVSSEELQRKTRRSGTFVNDPSVEGKVSFETNKTEEVGEPQKSVVTPAQVNKTPKVVKPVERRSVLSAKRNSTRKSVSAVAKVATGTPKSERKDPSASKILKPLFNVGRGDPTPKEGKGGSKPAGTSIPRFVTFARKIKVPNFNKIHERAFSRMEALDDYVDKKRKMELLNSGSKKSRPRPASGEIFKPAVTCVENLNLNFAETNSPANARKTPMSKTVNGKQADAKTPLATSKNPVESKSTKKSPRSSAKPSLVKLKSPKVLGKKSPGGGNLNRKSVPAKKSPAGGNLSRKSVPAKSPAGGNLSRKSVPAKSPTGGNLNRKSIPAKKSPAAGNLSRKSVPAKKSPAVGNQTKKAMHLSKTPGNGNYGRKSGPAKKSPGQGNLSKIPAAPHVGSRRKSPATAKASPRVRYSALPRPHKENADPDCASLASNTPFKGKSADVPSVTSGSMQKRQEYNPAASKTKPSNYMPYKGALKPLNTVANRKAMSEKIPLVKTTTERREDQRKILKGVRFNKRFELQMAKRGIDLTQ